MRPRDKRPNAWHAHRLVASAELSAIPLPLLDGLALGGLALGSLFGSSVARAGLDGAAFELTRRALELGAGTWPPAPAELERFRAEHARARAVTAPAPAGEPGERCGCFDYDRNAILRGVPGCPRCGGTGKVST